MSTITLRRKLSLILAALLPILPGCSLIPFHLHSSTNSGTATAVAATLGDINTSVKALKNSQDQLVAAVAAKDDHQAATNQFVADRVDEARYANANNPQPNGATSLVEANLAPAATAIGAVPSPAVKDQEIGDLKLALSQSAADKATLATTNQALAAQAAALQGQTVALNQVVKDREAALTTSTQAIDTATNQLAQASAQAKINAAETAAANAEAAKEAAAKVRLATARWFMLAGGVLFALGIVGLFFHIPDTWIASVAGTALIALGWAITYIEDLLQQPWFRYVLDGTILSSLGTLLWFGYRALQHRTATTTTSAAFSALVGAVQQAADKNPTLEAQLQPVLQEWLVTDKGAPDATVIAAINKMAASLNVVNPGQPTVASGTATAAAIAAPVVVQAPAPATIPAPAPVTGTVPTVSANKSS